MATGPTMIALLSPLHFTLLQLLIFFSLAGIREDNYLRRLSTGKRQPKLTLRKCKSTQRPNLQWPPESSQGGVENGIPCMYKVCLVSKGWRGQGTNGEAEGSWVFLPQSWQTPQVPVLPFPYIGQSEKEILIVTYGTPADPCSAGGGEGWLFLFLLCATQEFFTWAVVTVKCGVLAMTRD